MSRRLAAPTHIYGGTAIDSISLGEIGRSECRILPTYLLPSLPPLLPSAEGGVGGLRHGPRRLPLAEQLLGAVAQQLIVEAHFQPPQRKTTASQNG